MIQWEDYIKYHEIPKDKWLIQMDQGKLGRSVILYEKCFYRWIRSDVSIFTQNKGLICIEVKNSHDTLKRLAKELKGYSLIANYIYVYCSKNHLKGVHKIVQALHMENYVGIIVYNTIPSSNGDIIVPGLYRSAHKNNHFNINALMWVIWKNELLRILISNIGHLTYQPSKQGLSFKQVEEAKKSIFHARQPTKRMIINKMLKLFGTRKCLKLICDMFIYNDTDSEHTLNKTVFTD